VPYVNAKLCVTSSPELTARITALLTDLTVRILRKERTRTTVVVEYVPTAQWTVGGAIANRADPRRFYVEAKITAGTNSRDEKARYVHEVQRGLESSLGLGQAEGYVFVQELPADSWGHDGETQEVRYVRNSFAFQVEEAGRTHPKDRHPESA